MDYIGEQLWAGQLGRLLILLSLISSVLATIAYYKAATVKDLQGAAGWRQFGRVSFSIDVISVIGIFAMLLYIISAHRFEYFYAWSHSERSLNFKYLLSCIWEGQEGSFLLWTFWHGILGLILIRTAKKWEAPVMTVVSFAQACLATMIMGMYFFGAKVGSNPFLLVREVFQDAPIFQRADYLTIQQMQDGQGLNQLLQNYWMVIHPPILFLGFASTLIPFAYAVAGLWRKDYSGWTKVALPWGLFSAAILGTGIMLGAIWAYESLTFGGYWAWDPVENASMVPWLVLLAGVHTQVIYNSTGHSLRATYLFYILTFLLILYSTFLTRSGVLGDTSVHAFTDLGMNFQLVLFLLVFTIPSLALFFTRYRNIPHIAREESSYSREFWMFIGSLVMFLSALFVIISTSLPVLNKVFKTSWAVGEDVEFAYNRIQIFVAIILGLLTAISQFLKYRNTTRSYFAKKIWLPTLISIAISASISLFGNINYVKYGAGFLAAIHLAIFAGVYAVVGNAAYIWSGLKGKFAAAGASVGHVGFGLFLVGILISSSKKEVLSLNTTVALPFDPKSKENPMENQTLFQGMRTDMGKYWTTFLNSDSTTDNGKISYFNILFESKDGKDKFSLYPNLIKNSKGQEGFSNNPDAKHYWNRDIFTYISYARDMDKNQDTAKAKSFTVKVGDTIKYGFGFMTLDRVVVNPDNDRYQFRDSDTAVMADITVWSNDAKKYKARPAFFLRNGVPQHTPDTVISQNLTIAMPRVSGDGNLQIDVKESTGSLIPFVALKVYQFPFIRLVWLGTLLMVVGFCMAIVRRLRLLKNGRAEEEFIS